MKLKWIAYIIITTSLVSCTLEKFNISPINDILVPKNNSSAVRQLASANIYAETDTIIYSSELTNDISSFPKTSNDEVNKEINKLKLHIKKYIYALQENNVVEKNKLFSEIEISYKKIQKLRKKLSPKEDQLINMYLVKIKGNINKLQSITKKETISIQ